MRAKDGGLVACCSRCNGKLVVVAGDVDVVGVCSFALDVVTCAKRRRRLISLSTTFLQLCVIWRRGSIYSYRCFSNQILWLFATSLKRIPSFVAVHGLLQVNEPLFGRARCVTKLISCRHRWVHSCNLVYNLVLIGSISFI